MKIYLAGNQGHDIFKLFDYNFNKLDSFFYITKETTKNIKNYKRFMLDSGAFTFIMSKKKVRVDIDEFTDRYIEYIKNNEIDLFFEMDVDNVFGYEKVKQLRNKIENKTQKQSIPVFHTNRGLNDWIAMCKDYNYIALGIAGKDVSWVDWKAFYKFVMNAKEYNCKVHGLGITAMKCLQRVPFYSVDSTTWVNAGRFGEYQWFDGEKILKRQARSLGMKVRDDKKNELLINNLLQWKKFSEYMENKITASCVQY
jgi:hypothetical protein